MDVGACGFRRPEFAKEAEALCSEPICRPARNLACRPPGQNLRLKNRKAVSALLGRGSEVPVHPEIRAAPPLDRHPLESPNGAAPPGHTHPTLGTTRLKWLPHAAAHKPPDDPRCIRDTGVPRRLPRSCWPHASESYPRDPGEVRGRPRVAQELPTCYQRLQPHLCSYLCYATSSSSSSLCSASSSSSPPSNQR